MGETSIVKDYGKKLKGKLNDRDIMEMFVGYTDNNSNNVFRFINLNTKSIILGRDVAWLEKIHGEVFHTKNVATKYNVDGEANEDEYNIEMMLKMLKAWKLKRYHQ